MATAAVATPSHAFAHGEALQNAPTLPTTAATTAKAGVIDYTDPTTATKTKTCPITDKLEAKPPGPNQIYKQKNASYGDWRDDLARDGYVVVKGVIPKEHALAYSEEVFDYLENL